MNLEPLVLRELHVAVRRRSSYRIRMAVGAGAICVSIWAMLVGSGWTGASLGLWILRGLATITFVGGLVCGAILTADCLSREVRENTSALLVLTGLNSRELVLGKLAGKIVAPLYALIGMLPGFAVSSVVGGVTGGEFWRLLLVLANTLFFSLSAGLLTSSVSKQPRTAYGSALLLILWTAAAIPALGSELAAQSGNSLWSDLAALLSPTGPFKLAFDQRYAKAPLWFWSSIASTHLLAWLCAGLACRLMERRWDSAFESREAELEASPAATKLSRPGWIADASDSRPASNPIAWLAKRRQSSARLVWAMPVLVVGLIASRAINPFGNTPSQIGFLFWFAMHLIFLFWLASDAAHAFAGDRRSGALELLLGTPLHVREIASGMFEAFRTRFLLPALVVCLLDLFSAVRLLALGEAAAAFAIAAGAAMFLLSCYSACWIGLWRGLISLQSAIATLGTVGRVLIVPWFFSGMVAGLFPKSSPAELMLVWSLFSVFSNLIFVRGARRNLEEHFRVMALRPYGEKPPHIESEWSAMNWEEAQISSTAISSR